MKKILLTILIVFLLLTTLFIFKKSNDKNNDSEIVDNEPLINYAIISSKPINPFENIDFNKRIILDKAITNNKIDFDNTGITYENVEIGKFKLEVSDLKQVGLACHCGYCYATYYLLNNGELYRVNLNEGQLTEEDKNNPILLEKNVEAFDLLKSGIINEETCGGYFVVFKDRDGNKYIKYDEMDKAYEISQFERLWVKYTGLDNMDDTLYVVSENVKSKNYIKDENNENLHIKELYVFSGENESDEENSIIKLYMLNEDDYLYYLNESYVDNQNAKKYKDKKVIKIEDETENIKVTYDDNTTDTIYAFLEYK